MYSYTTFYISYYKKMMAVYPKCTKTVFDEYKDWVGSYFELAQSPVGWKQCMDHMHLPQNRFRIDQNCTHLQSRKKV